MGDFFTTAGVIVAILLSLSGAFKNFKDGKGAGLTGKQKSGELNLSAFEKINLAQARSLADAEIKVDKFEKKVKELEQQVKDLTAEVKELHDREDIRDRRELTLAGTLTYHNVPIPDLPPLAAD